MTMSFPVMTVSLHVPQSKNFVKLQKETRLNELPSAFVITLVKNEREVI